MLWLAVGVSHHRVRAETIAALSGRADEILGRLVGPETGIAGVLPVATCNRVEFHIEATDGPLAIHTATAAFAAVEPDVSDVLTIRSGGDAVRHLFGVAAGLDSMVVGEDQISGQVRHGLRVAEPTLTPALRRLGEAALGTAKAVAGRTGLGAVGRSIATVGLDRSGIADWDRASVLVLGTGSYARVVVADLHRRGCARIMVSSASSRRAERFAATHPVAIVTDLAAALADSDLVVACSGNRRLIDARTLAGLRPAIVDLSGGTDVDPAVRDLGVELLTMDQLAEQVPTLDGAALAEAHALVEQSVADFLADQRGREAAGTITALRGRVDELVQAELAWAAGRHSAETQQAIERSLRRLAQAMLHQPSTRAAAWARAGELEDYRHALATVFGPDLTAGQRS
ncbi:MAG: hypothetical protein QM628_17290 [Propionicimonas sp.]